MAASIGELVYRSPESNYMAKKERLKFDIDVKDKEHNRSRVHCNGVILSQYHVPLTNL